MTAEHDDPVVDPDNIPETICFGKLNVAVGPSGLSTITFTHPDRRSALSLKRAKLATKVSFVLE
jgi:hypothetical protein